MIGLHRLQGIDARAIVVHFSSVAVLFSLAALAVFDHSRPLGYILEGRPLLLLAGLGISATIGQLCLTRAFAAGPPAKVAVVGLTQIVFALALDRFVWDQQFSGLTLLGMGLVIAPTTWLLVHRG
jgi:drug/metabolite transporter (DMT)-like permease